MSDAGDLFNNFLITLNINCSGKRQIVYLPFTKAPDSSPARVDTGLQFGATDQPGCPYNRAVPCTCTWGG